MLLLLFGWWHFFPAFAQIQPTWHIKCQTRFPIRNNCVLVFKSTWQWSKKLQTLLFLFEKAWHENSTKYLELLRFFILLLNMTTDDSVNALYSHKSIIQTKTKEQKLWWYVCVVILLLPAEISQWQKWWPCRDFS